MIKVFIADDHRVLIDGIKSLLCDLDDIEVVGEALDGDATLTQLKQIEVDVLLLDINLPKKDGIEVCKILTKENPEIKVLALTMFNEASFIQGMLKSGAKGYLLKNSGRKEVVKAIRRVSEGESYFSEEVSNTLIQSIMPGGDKKTGTSLLIPKLTRREKEILQLIIEEYTNAEIAQKLFLSLSTVETHRKNLLSKVGARNTAGLVRIAIENQLLER